MANLRRLICLTVLGVSAQMATATVAADELPASAAEVTAKKAGDRAPAFTVRTIEDAAFTFDPDKLARPAVLITFRGGWCPYCNLHLSELRHVIPDIKALGYDVLFLSGDRPDQLYASLRADTQQDIAGRDYVILSDADTEAARAFGTAFRTDKRLTDYLDGKQHDYRNSSIAKHGALAVPAVYVVNSAGDIVYDFVNADYKIRLPADELLAVAQKFAP